MSGIGEVAYTVLLGWMRAVVDWFWSMVSGRGSSGVWQWFLSNWKIWLVVIIVGGLVVDWLMWVVRWRPYRLLLGKPRAATAGENQEDEAWDAGVGYYEPETAADSEPSDWTDLTMSTLSEIDPNWAGSVVIESEPITPYSAIHDPYYNEAYEEPPKAAAVDSLQDAGYWEETPDELEHPREEPVPEAFAYYDGPDMESWDEMGAADDIEETPNDMEFSDDAEFPDGVDAWDDADNPDASGYESAENTAQYAYDGQDAPAPAMDRADSAPVYGDSVPTPAIDPFRPYDEMPEAGYTGEWPAEAEEDGTLSANDDTSPQLYMRPGFWPGSFPFTQGDSKQETPAGPPEETPRTASSPPETGDWPSQREDAPAPRRRRRKLRESMDWQPEDPLPYTPAPPPATPADARASSIAEDTRPHRLVRPTQAPPDAPSGRKGRRGELRTVTGKPAERRGLMRFTAAQEEPIAGLPPMDLTDPFLPAARPENPDFAPDDGEEFYTEGE